MQNAGCSHASIPDKHGFLSKAPNLISTPTTIAQIDAWRAKPETENLEFKEAKQQFDSKKLLEYCVAISNEGGGYLLLGIADKPPRSVIGTKAFPNLKKVAADIFNNLNFRVDVEEVSHPGGRVVIFHIPSRPFDEPRQLNGKYLMRVNESILPMTPEQLKRIFNKQRQATLPPVYKILFAILIVAFVAALWFGITRKTHGTTDDVTGVVQHPAQPPEVAKQPLSGIQQSLDEINRNLSRMGQPSVSSAQMDEIREVDRFIVGRDEMALRQVFGFPSMLDINIQLNAEAIRHAKNGTPFDFQRYQNGREMMGDSALAEGHMHPAGGLLGLDNWFGTRVLLLVLPTEYSTEKKELLKFETSSELPNSVIKAVKDLDDAVSENAKKLLYTLDDALRKDTNYYLRHDDLGSQQYSRQIDRTWNREFIPLRPKADNIRMAIRQFLHVQ
jgi:hypothetical protein